MTFKCKKCKVIFTCKKGFKDHLEKRHGVRGIPMEKLFSSYMDVKEKNEEME
jgi:uncharacterized C2H2 Zn-finger protein